MNWYAVNGCHYYVPISSAKPKHQRMSNSLDFHKLQDARKKQYILQPHISSAIVSITAVSAQVEP